jgi:hypothetical protein
MSAIKIFARPAKLIGIDAGAFVFGCIILFLLSLIPLFISPVLSVCLAVCLGAAFTGDVLLWYFRGIRAVQADGNGLRIERGRLPDVSRIRNTEIRKVVIRSFIGSRTIVVIVNDEGSKARRIPRPAPRLRIGESPFSRDDFDRLIKAMGRTGSKRPIPLQSVRLR